MENIYELLENVDILEIYSDYELDKIIKKKIVTSREKFVETKDEEKTRYCQIELDTLNFSITDNKISYIFAGTNKNGDPFEYPNLKTFTTEDFEYLAERLKQTSNTYLTARYAHVLWHSTIKHNDFAVKSASSYLEIARELINHNQTPRLRIHILKSLKNAILISLKIKKFKIFKESKEFLLKLAHNFNDNIDLNLNSNLISFMLDHPKVFKKEDFLGLEQEIHKLASKEINFRRIDLLELGKKVDKKLGNINLLWDKEIGESYEAMSYSREDETKLISLQFTQDAITYFKLAKEESKVKELTTRFQLLKENMKLGMFCVNVDVTELRKSVREVSDKVSENDSYVILSSLMYDETLFPTYEQLEEQAVEQKQNHPLLFMSSNSVYDHNGLVSEHFSTEEENIYYAMLQNLHYAISLGQGQMLREIFTKSVLKGNLSANSFIQFIKEKSWLGQTISRKITQGETESYCWLNLIAPAISDYFYQLHFNLTNQSNYINLVLCIDSLSLKIEGILRDIINIKGGTSFHFSKDKKGEKVAREKDINALLHDPIIRDFISKDDLIFLKFLLVEKAGLNLRNIIAHSLIRHVENYSIDYMNLLLIAVLKLAKNEYLPLKSK